MYSSKGKEVKKMDLYELYRERKNEWDKERTDPTKNLRNRDSFDYLNNQTYKENNGQYSDYYRNRW